MLDVCMCVGVNLATTLPCASKSACVVTYLHERLTRTSVSVVLA